MRTTRAVLELLAPHGRPMLRMERWGPEADGGYVIPSELMQRATLLVTGGIADNLHFEADVARRVPNIRIALFDHTIEGLPGHAPGQAIWHKMGLSSSDSENFLSLESACALAGLTASDTLIVKLDIEGDEWEVLDAVSPEFMDRISVLVIEYHHFERRNRWKSYRRVLEKLNARMIPVHVHGNNHSPLLTINRYGVDIPCVLEVTYIKREDASGSVWTEGAPTPLDRPNLIGVEDHSFDYWSDLSRKYRQRSWKRALRLLAGRRR